MNVLTVDLTQHSEKVVNDILRGTIYGALSVNDVMPDTEGNVSLSLGDIPDSSLRSLAAKADSSVTYTKTETDAAIAAKANKKNAYNYIKQLEDFLFEVEYSTENINQEYCYNYFSEPLNNDGIELGGACTGVYYNKKALRQYDWNYDNEVEFLVRRPADIECGKYANIGIATAFPYFTKEVVEKGDYNEKYKLLAFSINDGINEKGMFIQGNVTPKKQGNINVAHTELPFKGKITTNMIGRIVLDNCATVDEAETELKHYDIIRLGKLDEHYDQHWLLADKEYGHAILEFTQDGTGFNFVKFGVGIEAELLTNFNVSAEDGVSRNSFRLDWDAISDDNINNIGLERWEIAADAVTHSGTDLYALREKLMYTNLYKNIITRSTENPIWYSEFSGTTDPISHEELTPSTAYEAKHNPSQAETTYAGSLANSIEEYNNRTRDGKTWQTVHSIIYDFEKLSMNVVIQERLENSKTYYLFDSPRIDVIDNLASTSATDALSAKQGRALDENKANKATTLGGYGITDAVKTVNSSTPDSNGNVAVQAFTGITNWFTSSEYYKVPTSTFCNALRTKIQQRFPGYKYDQCGLAFMFKGAVFTDFPNSFKNALDPSDIATGELFIYVISENLFYIDMYTTNNFQKKGDEGQTDALDAGKYTSIYDWGYNQNNHMRMLWNASLLCPQHLVPLDDGRYVYIPTRDYHAVSFYYLKQFADANNLILPEI